MTSADSTPPVPEDDPSGTVRLADVAEDLLAEARRSSAKRAGRTLIAGAGAPLKQALLALVEGTRLDDHESPSSATIQVLKGEVRVTSGEGDVDLTAGELAPIPPVRHGLQALSDAVVLLSVAQGGPAPGGER